MAICWADLHLFDPLRKAVPIKLDAGAHIDDLTLSLAGQRNTTGKRRSLIIASKGQIGQLQWLEPSH